MIRHIVLLHLTDSAGAEERAAIEEALEGLPGAIAEIRGYEIRWDLDLAEGNADLAVLADFDDVGGYETYRDHEAHRRVITELIAPVLAQRTAVQIPWGAAST